MNMSNALFRGAVLVLAVVFLNAAAQPLFGQPPPPQAPQGPMLAPPGFGQQPPAQTQGMGRLATAPPGTTPAPVQSSTYYNNVVAAPVGGYYPGIDPYGGYMNGKANVINATGQYYSQLQQARQASEVANQMQIDTRNKLIQQRMYEASITPNSEDVRQQEMMQKLRVSRSNPPQQDIWSGMALNSLLTAIAGPTNNGIRASSVPLPEGALAHINYTTGKAHVGLGLLRDNGKFDWPLILQDDAFKKQRDRIDLLAPQAVMQATMGRVEPKILRELPSLCDVMDQNLKLMVSSAAPDEYMIGKKYLRELRASFKILESPDIASYFGRYTPRGNTVAELVQHMSDLGLTFTPCVPGDETWYVSLYQSFLKYDTELGQLVTRASSPR
jgi:hypothetical protein